jgi:hypothetical protein
LLNPRRAFFASDNLRLQGLSEILAIGTYSGYSKEESGELPLSAFADGGESAAMMREQETKSYPRKVNEIIYLYLHLVRFTSTYRYYILFIF